MPNIDGSRDAIRVGISTATRRASPHGNVTAHELSEAITDPQLNAWFTPAARRTRISVRGFFRTT